MTEYMFELYKGHYITYILRPESSFRCQAHIENYNMTYMSKTWSCLRENLYKVIDDSTINLKQDEIGDPE